MSPNKTSNQKVKIPLESNVTLQGILHFSPDDAGIVLFSHGSGSGRLSPRNTFVAHELHKANIGTLLFDLLTEEEDLAYENRFDISMLTERLIETTQWVASRMGKTSRPIGYFGASTGSASALRASVLSHIKISAVVSRGGRPDLVEEDILKKVTSPTLLLVGGDDMDVIALNRQAFGFLRQPKELIVILGASHLFEEPGTLEEVSDHARDWFSRFFT